MYFVNSRLEFEIRTRRYTSMRRYTSIRKYTSEKGIWVSNVAGYERH